MDRPGFSFLVSPDSALIKQELEKQAATWKGAARPKRLVFWGDEEPGDSFWEALSQAGLFSEKKIIIVRQAENWPQAVWKQISIALGRELDHVWPFFCLEVEVERGKLRIPAYIQKQRCFVFADKKGWVWRSPGLGPNIQRFVREQAKKLGLVLEAEELSAFCANCPQDAQGIISELQKLSSLSCDGRIRPEWIQGGELMFEQDAFTLLRRILAGDLTGTWPAISADSEGSLLFFLIAMLSRDFRIFWQILSGEEPRLYGADAARKRELARKLGYPGVGDGFAALADAEYQVKSGRLTPGQALERLAVGMTGLFTRV